MPLLYSLGHSTRNLEETVSLLQEHAIGLLVDVRRFPVSRRHPHFGRERLETGLRSAGIRYRHEGALGGHRMPAPGSLHTAWREEAFRGYADHMGSREFQEALERGLGLCAATTTAVMCAEADPRRC